MHWRQASLVALLALALSACQGSPAAPVRLLSMGHPYRETKEAVISSPAVAERVRGYGPVKARALAEAAAAWRALDAEWARQADVPMAQPA